MSQGEGRPAREGDWICAACGAVHESNDGPCRECAGERFARLEPGTTGRIDQTATIEYRCRECGKRQPKNSTPCNRCGNLTFEPIEIDRGVSDPSLDDPDSASGRRITAGSIIGNLYGGLTLLNGLAWFVFSIFSGAFWVAGALIAIPRTRRWIESQFGITFSGGAAVVCVALLHLVAAGLSVAAAA